MPPLAHVIIVTTHNNTNIPTKPKTTDKQKSYAMSYKDQQEPLVEALRYVSPLAHDALTYACLRNLGAYARTKLKDDGVNVSDWFDALSAFVGALCKRCVGMEITAICQCVFALCPVFPVCVCVCLCQLVVSFAHTFAS